MFMTTSDEAPRPGAVISVKQAKQFIRAYRDRMAATKVAFEKLEQATGLKGPFDPRNETLGWVFSREVLEDVIHRVGKKEDYFVLMFGVAPKEHQADGEPVPGSPQVVHAMLTPASRTGDNAFLINKLSPAFAENDEFGAEQGNTCCQGGSLFDCTDNLLATGTIA